ncbi:hypothetical protein PUN28_005075 [Cardiocondyla obscurior]|uniref:Uncharacterized protein n=1 Tax=Cardiocondyla obscurior TaxID=286306 RepID=A0AAW2GE27_9HYME
MPRPFLNAKESTLMLYEALLETACNPNATLCAVQSLLESSPAQSFLASKQFYEVVPEPRPIENTAAISERHVCCKRIRGDSGDIKYEETGKRGNSLKFEERGGFSLICFRPISEKTHTSSPRSPPSRRLPEELDPGHIRMSSHAFISNERFRASGKRSISRARVLARPTVRFQCFIFSPARSYPREKIKGRRAKIVIAP